MYNGVLIREASVLFGVIKRMSGRIRMVTDFLKINDSLRTSGTLDIKGFDQFSIKTGFLRIRRNKLKRPFDRSQRPEIPNRYPIQSGSAPELKVPFDLHSRETSNGLEIWHRGPINSPKSPILDRGLAPVEVSFSTGAARRDLSRVPRAEPRRAARSAPGYAAVARSSCEYQKVKLAPP